jgi:protein-serine/threonine kinase
MPTPNINVTNPTNNAAGASVPTGEDDGGGGESEPANESKKATLDSGSGANNALQIPKSNVSTIAGTKSPKSPNRPQISVEITPATPSGSVFSHRPSATPNSPHEAVQSWVKAQDAHLDSHQDPATASPSPSKGPLQKRDSVPATPALRNRRPSTSSQKSVPRPPSAAGSTSGGEGKFSLKDLLGGGPKLSRRNSASSKKSISSGKAGSVKGGSQKGGSTGGESGLESKYGVYGKIAVGKGATSIVRLAHKWDRTEDKLYAVKVSSPLPTYPAILVKRSPN